MCLGYNPLIRPLPIKTCRKHSGSLRMATQRPVSRPTRSRSGTEPGYLFTWLGCFVVLATCFILYWPTDADTVVNKYIEDMYLDELEPRELAERLATLKEMSKMPGLTTTVKKTIDTIFGTRAALPPASSITTSDKLFQVFSRFFALRDEHVLTEYVCAYDTNDHFHRREAALFGFTIGQAFGEKCRNGRAAILDYVVPKYYGPLPKGGLRA